MTVKLSISLTDQQAEYAKKLVEEGRYSSTSAVIQQALEERRREDEDYEAQKTAFFEMLIERANGPHVSSEEFDKMVEGMLAEKRVKYGVDS